ncbi:right-handed parallel beta-helix repeat-containing protein [Natronococcus sp.]|uniref:right-handed parallel beta-helix repeat-containing protein n=1 Tax=Natronococcus sp. TaxID=35747 RepID=UPI003A4D3613
MGLGLAASTSVAASDDDSPTPIDSPTVIEEPGEYELVADLEPDSLDQPACVVVDSDGVTLRGNAHTIDVSEATVERFGRPARPSGIVVNPDPGGQEVNWETTIEDVELRGGNAGIYAQLSLGGRYRNITAAENDSGFEFYVDGGTLENCLVEDNWRGIHLDGNPDFWGGSDAVLENCTMRQNGREGDGERTGAGIHVGHGSRASIDSGRIVGNGNGITASAWETHTDVSESHICYNDHYGIEAGTEQGFEADDEYWPPMQGTVDATDNYWGAANGPSSRVTVEWRQRVEEADEPFMDPETGQPADGDGDAISESLDAGVSNVYFDPFSEVPLEDVGAQR